MGENSSALGSIPSTECLRSITSLVHLPLPSATAGWLRRKTASVICVSIFYAGCGLTRSSTAIERPDFSPGDVGSIPIGSVNLDGPLSLGYRKSSLEDERVQIPRHQVTDDFPTRPLSVVLFGMGRCASVIELGSSTATERLVKTRRCGFESRPETSRPPLVHPSALFDGSQDWVIAHNDVVAGSSPAFGTRRRGSSVVEHVNSQFTLYPSD